MKRKSSKTAQHRAVENDRRRMKARGMARYEVRGLVADKALLRNLADRLAKGDTQAQTLREEMHRHLTPDSAPPGATWNWLRASPLVDVDWYPEREFVAGRDVDL